MRPPVAHHTILWSILRKDFRLYGRNKIYLFLTVLSLAFFVLIFWVVPDTVDETITLAISPPLSTMVIEARKVFGIPEAYLEQLDPAHLSREEGLDLVELESADQLARAIAGRLEVYRAADGRLILRDLEAGDLKPAQAARVRLDIGIAFPASFIADTARGERTAVTVFTRAAVPGEIRGAVQSLVREVGYQVAGRPVPVELPAPQTIVLGRDRVGDQPSLRDKLRPMLAVFILMVETYAMASLISTEILQRTVTALMVTPMRLWHFLAAKTIFGVVLALGQGVVVLALVGAFTTANWSLLLTTMLIGAILFTSVAMLIGAAGKEFMSQLMYALLFTVPLMIPAFSVLFLGTAAAWVRAIPSYPVIDLIVRATAYDARWQDSWGALAYALLWAAAVYGAGLSVLKRRAESL